MTHYLVLGAVRIQTWITRTPRLALTRGASLALTERTSTAHLGPRFPGPLRISNEAPEIAGVVVLESPTPVTNADIRGALDVVSDELPGVEWSAWTAEADSYIAAYRATRGGDRADRSFRRSPNLRRLPMLTECDGCHEESATRRVDLPGGRSAYGQDCLLRRETMERERPETTAGSHIKEATEFQHLTKVEEKPASGSENRQIHALGRRDADNHLALISADGNRMGDFFKAVAALGSPDAHLSLSKALDTATRGACSDARGATVAQMVSPRYYPDVVHYVGGDDVLASVAARFAWIWAVELAVAFQRRFTADVGAALDGLQSVSSEHKNAIRKTAEAASLGIGMAFTHSKFPFAGARTLSVSAEKRAKAAGQGRLAAIAWADTTTEAVAPVSNWIKATDAANELALGHRLRWLGPNARATLSDCLRHTAPRDQPKAVEDWLKRNRYSSRVSDMLPNHDLADCRRLATDLDRARWWPTRPSDTSEDA